MKQVDLGKIHKKQNGGDGLQRVQDFLVDALSRVGITLEGEGNAGEAVTKQFGRLLDNRYTMLRNVYLPTASKSIPLILVGPSGVYVINPRPETGVFRAREDTWVQMNQRTQQYEVGRENFLEQTLACANQVENYLRENGFMVTSVQPLLVFANPGAHVESSRPIVRILPIDALDRYVATLAQGQQVISIEENMAIVESLSAPPLPPQPVAEPASTPKTPAAQPPLADQIPLPSFLANLGLTSRQWMVIGVMAFFEIVILIVLIFLVVLQS